MSDLLYDYLVLAFIAAVCGLILGLSIVGVDCLA